MAFPSDSTNESAVHRGRANTAAGLPTTIPRRRASVVTSNEEVTSSVASSVTAPDMTLFISNSGHTATVLSIVKKDLFPIVKFITSNNQLDYNATKGICGFMLAACNVKVNSRAWWCHYKLKVKSGLANHRNNRIKSMQQSYIGTCNHSVGFVAITAPILTHCIKLQSTNILSSMRRETKHMVMFHNLQRM
jgi:hypothetical protein